MNEGGTVSLQEYFDHAAAYQAKIIDSSAAYNQVVVLAGYAGYFALWSSMEPQMPRWLVGLCGGLMIISIVIYVGWMVLNMVAMRSHIDRMMETISHGPIGFVERVKAEEVRAIKARRGLMRHWRPVVYAAGGSGLASAVLLAGAAFGIALS